MGTLWVVATPIGNLEDMTHRAVRVLGAVVRILCEDTRRTRALLEHFAIPSPEHGLVRFDAHAERDRISDVLDWLSHGEDIALVSDAGTPGLNDPGERLVRAVAAADHRIIPVPGASAITTAISASGLGGGGFSFGGFLPKALEAQRSRLASLSVGTWSFFAPARDLPEVLASMAAMPNIGHVVVARELTKLHESFYRGSAQHLALALANDPESQLGEAVLVFEVIEPELDDALIATMLRAQLALGKSPKVAVETVSGALGLPRRRVYQIALGLEKNDAR